MLFPIVTNVAAEVKPNYKFPLGPAHMSTDSRKAQRYSRDQRAAIMDAIFDHGMTANAAISAAKKGELPINGREKLDAYDVPPNTVSRWRTDERSEREEQKPRDMIESALKRVVQLANSELQAELDKRHGDRDMQKLKATTDALAKAQTLAEALENKAAETPPKAETDPNRPPSTAEKLATAAQERG